MPELAEVAYFCRQWTTPGMGHCVRRIHLHKTKRVFRDTDPALIADTLEGSRLCRGEARGKQMLFSFEGGNLPGGHKGWLGVHLGMTGKLFAKPLPYAGDKHDHLIWETDGHALVFRDPRLFGKIKFLAGPEVPSHWRDLPPEVLSAQFTTDYLKAFLQRRAVSPIKAVLLDQRCFPGVGNWMADEMLWQAEIHPATPAGAITGDPLRKLHRKIRHVCRVALRTVGKDYRDPPNTWLFARRWKDGGRCPVSGELLIRETIGGRTTCYSPQRQVRSGGI